MKKFVITTLLICLLLPSLAFAKKQTKEQPIPERFASVMEVCNATTIAEMHRNLVDCINVKINPAWDGHYTTQNTTLSVRFGGTTEELIADQRNWKMAVVSTKDVDIQKLLDNDMIKHCSFSTMEPAALSLWLIPSSLKTFRPKDLTQAYEVYFFDYDAQTNDATILILNNKKEMTENVIPQAILEMRSAEQKRSMEGIARVHNWTVEELIANPNDWDTAHIKAPYPDGLEQLDQAGMLLDLSQSTYLASRKSVEKGVGGWDGLPNGIFSADGRLIGVPCYPFDVYDEDDQVQVLIVNAKSNYIDAAISYVEYHIKSLEAVAFCPDYEETWDRIVMEYSTALWQ